MLALCPSTWLLLPLSLLPTPPLAPPGDDATALARLSVTYRGSAFLQHDARFGALRLARVP